MYICLICGRKFETIKKLSSHIARKHKIKKEIYYSMFNNITNCIICGKKTSFIDISKGYRDFCCSKCAAICKNTKEKRKITNIKKYNVENISELKEIKQKKEKTTLENYGVKHHSQSEEIKEKIKQTCLEKYNSICYLSSDKGKKHGNKQKLYNFFNKLIKSDRIKDIVIPLFNIEDYNGIKHNKYPWKCVKCNTEFEDDIDSGRIPRCPQCYPYFYSKFEEEVLTFCKQYYPNLIENDRSILNGRELDIYIPEINIAIECNGLYWHSELNGKDKEYHLNKTIECKEKGVNLIQIFEDEWYNKQDIVKSILLAKFGKIKNKIYARKCIVKEINKKESDDFLFENHLQGEINGKTIGLYYNDELVSVLTYGKPRFNKKYDIEILRFCNKKNTVVIGGLSKLIKKLNGSIISYCDLRYSNGKGYESAGFTYLKTSDPNYWYIKNKKRYSRQKFQKNKLFDKLEYFDSTLTEKENMLINGYNILWDCGNLEFTIEIKSGQNK